MECDSALLGSSFIQIPFWLKYFTDGIEYHYIHHINSKIPNYNLHAYHEEVINKNDMYDNIKHYYNNINERLL